MSRLEAINATKTFALRNGSSLTALTNLSFQVRSGEFVSIVGRSGCGKSTVLKLFAGLESVTDGEVKIDDRKVTGPITDVGMVFQRPVLIPWRNVLDNVLLPAELLKLDVREATDRARGLLRAVGLEQFLNSYPRELSGGMQHRVAIARGFITKPKILLMDEPFAALDMLTREGMSSLLTTLWHEAGHQTVMFVTHDVEEAVLLSDRVLVVSERPGTIRDQVVVDLPRPRGGEMRTDPKFVDYCAQVREELLKTT